MVPARGGPATGMCGGYHAARKRAMLRLAGMSCRRLLALEAGSHVNSLAWHHQALQGVPGRPALHAPHSRPGLRSIAGNPWPTMRPSRRSITRLASVPLQAASACAAAAPSQPGAPGLPSALLRQLSSASSALGAPHEQTGAGPDPAAARQRQRRRSRYAASTSTSGRGFSSSAPTAAARSSSASPPPARGKSTLAPAAAAAAAVPPPHPAVAQALQAAARRVRQADARLKAAAASPLRDLDRPLPRYQERETRRSAAGDDGMTLRRVANFTKDIGPPEPVWARHAAAEGSPESHAALALYRQEVLHGHDVSGRPRLRPRACCWGLLPPALLLGRCRLPCRLRPRCFLAHVSPIACRLDRQGRAALPRTLPLVHTHPHRRPSLPPPPPPPLPCSPRWRSPPPAALCTCPSCALACLLRTRATACRAS